VLLLFGVGGDEAAKYSRELFEKVFSGEYQVMNFLDKWGHVPSSYKTADREAFQAECDKAIEAIKVKP